MSVAATTSAKTVKGLLGKKLGMPQVWDADNRLVPVTVVEAGPCVVTQVRNGATDGYDAVQLAFGAIDPRKVTQPLAGHFEKAGVTPRRHLVELRTADAGEYTLGQELGADTFEAGQVVDVRRPAVAHQLQAGCLVEDHRRLGSVRVAQAHHQLG